MKRKVEKDEPDWSNFSIISQVSTNVGLANGREEGSIGNNQVSIEPCVPE
jgi:hypothetical protein